MLPQSSLTSILVKPSRYNINVSLLALLISFAIYLSSSGLALAIYDPLSVPNNKIGIHILFPDELVTAAKLVNRNQEGEWGYVTIPIQASDRDRRKWQKFFDSCRENKIIPLVRVATVPEGSNWVIPNNFDLVDFANFLGDLNWPTQNRYVIIFNEVNRSDEYGGFVSPENYADILNNAIDIFKNKSSDFFILPAGLDNAASNSSTSINWRRYLERMYLHTPNIFSKIDGWTSHAYPNPDFSARPDRSGYNKIDSFRSDLKFIHLFTTKKLPIFITETGWSNKNLSEHQIALCYQYALSHQWADQNIVAITPFLLNAQDGPFVIFSFQKDDKTLVESAETLSLFATKGQPLLASEKNDLIVHPPVSTSSSQPTSTADNTKTLLKRFYNSLQSLLNLFQL